MMALLAFAAIAALALLLFVLPFAPAMIEWRRVDGIEPLAIPAEHDGDVRHFAKRFRAYVAADTARQLDETTAEHSARQVATLRAFIVAPTPLVVDREAVLPGDVYAKSSVYGWEDVVYRGLLADQHVALGRRSRVTRWIHAMHTLRVGASSTLLGRASADEALRVEDGTSFEWLSAPRIEFGVPANPLTPAPSLETSHPPSTTCQAPVLRIIHGDLDIPPDSVIDEDVIVSGSLRVGARSVIWGSLKSHSALHLAEDVSVCGSVVSNTEITVADDCRIGGVVVAERFIRIGARTRIGSEIAPSTVSAPAITIAPNTLAHGTVWARDMGHVTA